jgi:hypothetical protein
MKRKTPSESTPSERRRALEEDVEKFLKAGNQIQYIEDGVSAQDPQGKGKPLRLGRPKDEAPKDPKAKP